ncbi:putative phosphothreonine lyase domain-containing protein [Paraburkholderia xenovorans]|uniref:putative phosphothreonine lyase domain-containing protein n=1 Tax=Paraburkholderia xenovorans TaxID=36873 RepID=UPI0038B6EBDA
MKEEIGAEARLFRKSDKPSEDLSCNWHYKKSPSYNDFASTDAAGKWCIFVSSAEVDEEWSKIRDAVAGDQLMCAKVSTARRTMSRDGHVICVYTRDWADREDLMRAREVLRSLGFLEELGYKRDIDTRSGKYGLHEWHLRA